MLLTWAAHLTYHESMTARDIDSGGYRGTSPPPITMPQHGPRHLIDRPADLLTAAETLAAAPVLAIDAEFVAARSLEEHLPPRLALIQISDNAQCWVIDALRLNDLSPLQKALANPSIVKLFHDVGSDLRVLATRGLSVSHTIDLEAASRSIFGSHESSLQAMLQRACGLRLDKTLQRSDWTIRPLPSSMFQYAARDAETTYLLYVWLLEYYPWAIAFHEMQPEDPTPADLVAPWLAFFVQGERSFTPEIMEELGDEPNFADLTRDCLDALAVLPRPQWRVRVYRTAANLALTGVIPHMRLALKAPASEERAAAARALGRLRATEARDDLIAAENDPVYDVRKATLAALEQLDLPPRVVRFSHSGPIEETPAPDVAAEDAGPEPDWKAKLRGLLPPESESGN
jgi:hypothetical protein